MEYVYYILISNNQLTIEEVPEEFKDKVKELLEK